MSPWACRLINAATSACLLGRYEDAAVLAHCLSTCATLRDALAAYERARVARTTAIVNASWRFGRLAQTEGRFCCWLRDLARRSTPQSLIRRRLLESAGFSLA